MATIITITLNTAIDRVIELSALTPGSVNESARYLEIAAGKGINVSRALASADIKSTAVFFCGRSDGNLFQNLASKYLNPISFSVNGPTRSNFTLVETNHRRVTHIKTSGYEVSVDEIETLIASIVEVVHEEDVVVISGSLPPGVDDTHFRRLLQALTNMKARLFVDINPSSYSTALSFRPFVIKPNLDELEKIVGRALPDNRAITAAAKALTQAGANIVLVTLGPDGAIAASKDEASALLLSIRHQDRPTDGDAVGSGDAFLAGFIEARLRGVSFRECVVNACAFGAANQTSAVPGQIHPNDVRHFLPLVETAKI